jgi:WD40 repeat protein
MLVYEGPYLTVYDTTTWKKLLQQAMLPDGYIMYYDISSDFSLMAVCDRGLDDQPVRIWNVATATLLKSLPHEFGKCGRLLFTPDGKYLLFFNNHGAGPMV